MEWINLSSACWVSSYLLCVTIMCFLFLSPFVFILQVILVNISLFFCSYFPTTVWMKCFYSQQLWYQMWVGFPHSAKQLFNSLSLQQWHWLPSSDSKRRSWVKRKNQVLGAKVVSTSDDSAVTSRVPALTPYQSEEYVVIFTELCESFSLLPPVFVFVFNKGYKGMASWSTLGEFWTEPKHRILCPHGVGHCHPPCRWKCCPTLRVSVHCCSWGFYGGFIID